MILFKRQKAHISMQRNQGEQSAWRVVGTDYAAQGALAFLTVQCHYTTSSTCSPVYLSIGFRAAITC